MDQSIQPDAFGESRFGLVRSGRRRFPEQAHIRQKLKRPKPDGRAFIISEFGGYNLKIPNHMWNGNKKFSYRFYDSLKALMEAYLALLENELMPLTAQGLTAAVYTQTTNMEIEINGYLTYDRKVEKMDAQVLRQAHASLWKQMRLYPDHSLKAPGSDVVLIKSSTSSSLANANAVTVSAPP